MRITHVACTENFAGVERHVAGLARGLHDRGHEVTVLGGDQPRMRAAIAREGVTLVPAPSPAAAMRQLCGPAGREADVVATHMTAADLVAALCPVLRSTPHVSTRHFPARRGSRREVKAAVGASEWRIDAEIAVSRYIARSIGREAVVIHPGVADLPDGADPSQRPRTVLAAQRLEREKSTDVALRAFAASGLAGSGWRLVVAGDGAERLSLERLAADLGIAPATDFVGHHPDVPGLMAEAAVLVAPCAVEGLGLTVVEAMASGLPVVASAAGGHLETAGSVPGAALFPAGDADAAGALLAGLAADPGRLDAYGAALRERQREGFSLAAQAKATEAVYEHVVAGRPPTDAVPGAGAPTAGGRDLVVVSLEPWDEVWRRNQHLVAGLLREDPRLRVLFVEPAADPVHAVRIGEPPRPGRGLRRGPHVPGVAPGALWLYQPTKVLPRRVDPAQDERWARGVRDAAGRLGMARPVLWVNDPLGAELLTLIRWPTLYDITDDWLVAERDEATHERLARQEQRLMADAAEVVVCSPGLVRSKSAARTVTLVQNAVDADATRSPFARPADLPTGPVALYLGTLHGDRLDVDLCVATARRLSGTATLVLVGPDALRPDERARLDTAGVLRLGRRPAAEVPGYLQHADVLVVPHVVDEFTDSLDPIKLYEYRAVGRPVVSTPVHGFREAAGRRLTVAAGDDFVAAVRAALPATDHFPAHVDEGVPTWADRVREIRAVLDRVTAPAPDRPATLVPIDVQVILGHGAVQYVAEDVGADVLHVKGHALDETLRSPGRSSTDVDVLVRPRDVERFLRALREEGFVPAGRFETSSPFEHSLTLRHPHWGFVDVHRVFPGTGRSPEAAFDHLWSGRQVRTIGTVPCPVPATDAHAVLLVLHAARESRDGHVERDVQRVWRDADEAQRARIRAEVRALEAEVAFAVGTGEIDGAPPTPERHLWTVVSNGGGRVEEWRARLAAADGVRAKLRIIGRAPLVNTDHMTMLLGRRPSRREVVREFFDRGRRAVLELGAPVRRGRR